MKTTASGLGVAVILAMWGATPSGAQELVLGTWTGSISPPGGEAIPVTYEVGDEGGALSVVMRSTVIDGEMPFFDVRIEGPHLTFWWNPGVRVECALQRTADGGYEGMCADGGGANGQGFLTMMPPSERPN